MKTYFLYSEQRRGFSWHAFSSPGSKRFFWFKEVRKKYREVRNRRAKSKVNIFGFDFFFQFFIASKLMITRNSYAYWSTSRSLIPLNRVKISFLDSPLNWVFVIKEKGVCSFTAYELKIQWIIIYTRFLEKQEEKNGSGS